MIQWLSLSPVFKLTKTVDIQFHSSLYNIFRLLDLMISLFLFIKPLRWTFETPFFESVFHLPA